MVFTNSIVGIAKILGEPKQKILDDNISLTKYIAQLEQFNDGFVTNLIFWNDIVYDTIEQYQLEDYIFIEGQISLPENNTDIDTNEFKKVDLTISKAYLLY